MSFVANICLALLLRVIFMLYGLWQDSTMVVKYTDVDYYVFTDAAEFITKVIIQTRTSFEISCL